MNRFSVLDSFRGLCALFVVVFHMHIVDSFSEFNFFRHSSIFVDFFFILSGFVITHSYFSKKEFKLSNFLISRTFRLVPLHFVMLAVFILFEIGKLVASSRGLMFNNAPFTGVNDLSEIIPNLLLIQSWHSSFESLSFNFPSWSISVEYFVYLIFAFTVIFKGNIKYFVWIAVSAGMFYCIYSKNEILTAVAMNGLSCFFAGALTYLIHLKINNRVFVNPLFATFIEAVVICTAVYVVNIDFEHKEIVIGLVFSSVILVFSFEIGLLSTLLKKPWFGYLGKLSYSIYMTHAAIIFVAISIMIIMQKVLGAEVAPMIGGVRHIDLGNSIANNILALSVVVLVVLVSNFTYKFVETRGQSMGKNFLTAFNKKKFNKVKSAKS